MEKKIILIHILGGECLKWAVRTTVLENSGVRQDVSNPSVLTLNRSWSRPPGTRLRLICLAATFAKTAVW